MADDNGIGLVIDGAGTAARPRTEVARLSGT
jgi:hypothetical protein